MDSSSTPTTNWWSCDEVTVVYDSDDEVSASHTLVQRATTSSRYETIVIDDSEKEVSAPPAMAHPAAPALAHPAQSALALLALHALAHPPTPALALPARPTSRALRLGTSCAGRARASNSESPVITLIDDSDDEDEGFLALPPPPANVTPSANIDVLGPASLQAVVRTVRAVISGMPRSNAVPQLMDVLNACSDVKIAKLHMDHLYLKAFQVATLLTGRPTRHDRDGAGHLVIPQSGKSKLFLLGTYIDADEVTRPKGLYEGKGAGVAKGNKGIVRRAVEHNGASHRQNNPCFYHDKGYKSGREHLFLKNWALDKVAYDQVLATLRQWGVPGNDDDLRGHHLPHGGPRHLSEGSGSHDVRQGRSRKRRLRRRPEDRQLEHRGRSGTSRRPEHRSHSGGASCYSPSCFSESTISRSRC